MGQLQVEAEAAGGGVEHAQPLGRRLLADAVAGDDGDAIFLAGHGRSLRSGGATCRARRGGQDPGGGPAARGRCARPGYAMPPPRLCPTGTRHAPQPPPTSPPMPIIVLRGRHHPGTAEPLPRQGARQLRPAGRAADHHRHRPPERLRPHPRRHSAQGPGADPDGALLVRGHRRHLPQPRHRVSRPERAGRASGSTILPVEIVVRDYLAGTTGTSILTMYKAGQREMYGIRLPDGMRDNQKLPQTIITPTSKAFDGGHDEPLTPAEIVGAGPADRGAVGRRSRPTPWRCSPGAGRWRRERGLILVDTKYEFGIDEDGTIVLADEIHTPDSSRYWFAGQLPAALRGRRARRRASTRTSSAAGSSPAATPTRTRSRRSRRRCARGRADLYRGLRDHHRHRRFPLPDPAEPVLERIRANLRPYF